MMTEDYFNDGKQKEDQRPMPPKYDSTMQIDVYSYGWGAGSEAHILIDGQVVEIQPNLNGHKRGMNLVALDPVGQDILIA